MTREEIITANPLLPYLERRGIVLRGQGTERLSNRCPQVEHKVGHLCCSVNAEKEIWRCHDCEIGGSIIDWRAIESGKTPVDVLKELGGTNGALREEKPALGRSTTQETARPKLAKTYDYTDEAGKPVFQVCRLEPKSFRQRHVGPDGKWVWSMEGVRRVLYNLPKVLAADFVWIVEGEKDADTLISAGLVATCNVGGATKWLPEYSESLRGKEIIICGDNDEKGVEHVAKVLVETAATVRSSRVVKVPQEFKDVSDWVAADKSSAFVSLVEMAQEAETLVRGQRVPVYSMAEIEREYRDLAQRIETHSLNLGRWIPSFSHRIRPLIPGEMMVVVADTGVGKTMIAQNIALHTKLPTLMFSMELPRTLAFERYAAMATKRTGGSVFSAYSTKGDVPWRESGALDHLHICSDAKLKPEDIERIAGVAGLKMGVRPSVLIVDYLQLIKGQGERYNRISDAAEELKVLAKSLNCIVIALSQIARKKDDDGEIYIHDCKDSGSIENSCGVMLGAWRDEKDPTKILWLKILKNTKGIAGGYKTRCNIRESLLLDEMANQEEEPE